MSEDAATSAVLGHRAMNQAELEIIGFIKEAEKGVDKIVAAVQGTPAYPTPPSVTADLPSHDKHIAQLAKDHLMIGFMLLVRSIAKPGAVTAAAPPRTQD
jgi:hypothetical protein